MTGCPRSAARLLDRKASPWKLARPAPVYTGHEAQQLNQVFYTLSKLQVLYTLFITLFNNNT